MRHKCFVRGLGYYPGAQTKAGGFLRGPRGDSKQDFPVNGCIHVTM